MTDRERKSLIGILAVILIGLGLNAAGSSGGASWNGWPLYTIAVAASFIINWIVFVPAYMRQDEKFFDLTGSLCYIGISLLLLLLSPSRDLRTWLLWAMVTIWAVRLGSFLYQRVHKAGKDGRFDELKTSFPRFFMVWSIQALWVSFTAAAAWVAMTTLNQKPVGIIAIIGVLVWIAGMAIEIIADNQKTAFRADPANKDKFITTGLWARSRHPNYFGEIVLWLGVAIVALPVLQGWQWIALISPILVTLLLTRVSGVPLLEARADEKWGGQAEYEAYKENTPVLFPKLS